MHSTKVPSTLRYGSGIIDVPVASVLPHMAILGTVSGWWLNLADHPQDGEIFGDGAVAIGLFDRVELGATFQSFNDSDMGGNLVGGFGRLAILRPANQGIGLAVGARYVTEPEFDDFPDEDFQPTRHGYPDARLFDGAGGEEISTTFTPYAVATAALQGFDSDWLPRHDFTFSAGWGTGMFTDGENQEFYSYSDSEGAFVGSVLHVLVAENTLLNIMGEWNGFDVNVGAQLDFRGIRIGGFVAGSNYLENRTIPRSAKWGVLGSVAFCPSQGGLCRPSLLEREPEVPDTVRLPAPPPDTVTVEVEVEPPEPTGTPATLCLATGESVEVLVTAQNDTLVGPDRVSARDLRPGVVFAGTYAEGMEWFQNDDAITFEDASYQKSGGEVALECANIMQVGEFMGVPLFVMRDAERPYEMLYVPVRPGVWQAYQSGLQRTRGD